MLDTSYYFLGPGRLSCGLFESGRPLMRPGQQIPHFTSWF